MIQAVGAIQKDLVFSVTRSGRLLRSNNHIEAMLLRIEESILTGQDDRRVARRILLIDFQEYDIPAS